MEILEPEIAINRINGAKERDIKLQMDKGEWISLKRRVKTVGFDSVEDYLENLISLDIRNHVIELLLSQELRIHADSDYPLSRVADKTGLDICYVVSKAGKK